MKAIKEEFNNYNWQGENYFFESRTNFCFVIFEKITFVFYHNKNYNSITCDFFRNESDNKIRVSLGELIDYKIISEKRIIIYDDLANVDLNKYIKNIVEFINKHLIETIKGDKKVINSVLDIRLNIGIIRETYKTDMIFNTQAYIKMIEGNQNWKNYLRK